MTADLATLALKLRLYAAAFDNGWQHDSSYAPRLREAADAIDTLTAERDEWKLRHEIAARQRDLFDGFQARLAAAERVVEAARALIPGASSFLYNSPYRARYHDLREATEAYSEKQRED